MIYKNINLIYKYIYIYDRGPLGPPPPCGWWMVTGGSWKREVTRSSGGDGGAGAGGADGADSADGAGRAPGAKTSPRPPPCGWWDGRVGLVPRL